MFRLAVAVSLLISAVCAVGMRSLRLVCIVFLLSMSVSSVLCQSPTGVLPFESFSGDQFEHVNIANLNLNLTIPLVQKPGRGLPFYYGMSYDSQVWQISGSTWKRTTYPNWIYQNPRQPSYVDTHTTFSCFGDGADRYFFSSFTDGFGVTHSISLTLQTLCGISQGAVQSNDGSGLTFFAKLNTSTGRIQQVSLYDRSGNLVGAQDTNGNQITSSFSNGTTTWTDTLAWIIHQGSSQKRKDALKGMMNTGFADPAFPFGASIT